MRLKLVLGTAFLFGVFISCNKKENDQAPTTSSEEKHSDTESRATVLGEKLENPYSVEAFKEAYANLTKNARLSSDITIEATHYYIRFLPKDGEEFQDLKDLDLVLFDHPLDCEIVSEGAYYHDPTIPDSLYTWQYCVVKVGFEFPNIQYEKLSDLYLFDADANTSATRADINIESYELLEQETFKITGNELDPKLENGRVAASCGKWNPEATIRVFDDAKGVIPVEGVMVHFNRWFETYKKPTDASGVARCPASFRRQVNYTVVWETEQDWFDFRHGSYGQASFKFADQCGNASYNFHKNSFYWPYAISFNAAWYYYTHHNDFGIKQPPSSRGIWRERLHIGVHNSEITRPHYFQFNETWFQSAQVKLYYKDGDDDYNEYVSVHIDNNDVAQNDAVFPTVIHEIAHASHWEIYNLNSEWLGQKDGGRWMIESWADAVSIYLTRGYYGQESWIHNQFKSNNADKDHNNNYSNYSALYEDLIDDFNQNLAFNYQTNNLSCPNGFNLVNDRNYAGLTCMECHGGFESTDGTTFFLYPDNKGSFYHNTIGTPPCHNLEVYDGANCWVMDVPENTFGYIRGNNFYVEPYHDNVRPYDRVSGYTLGQIENLFRDKPRNAADLKKLIKDKLDNPTEIYLDEYFANYGY
jgi:hypothetical protein